ncbi:MULTISPECIES: UvrD-helicase domain-containing protein [Deefgea]|uniref:AAA family ATPase n=1 Tax=Deefgea chitinilytica TaxID=570276 RepID=A0ABS2CDV0_9NEIS|nr:MULTISPECIES: UvrD-helicase domain-containing protein [Deefgea]MBM5572325.1 AAA family ATPase [Deefgea chitinilytica]MBM9889561.1 AAA family ATPase [Deefgea sp. CFH1-16]
MSFSIKKLKFLNQTAEQRLSWTKKEVMQAAEEAADRAQFILNSTYDADTQTDELSKISYAVFQQIEDACWGMPSKQIFRIKEDRLGNINFDCKKSLKVVVAKLIRKKAWKRLFSQKWIEAKDVHARLNKEYGGADANGEAKPDYASKRAIRNKKDKNEENERFLADFKVWNKETGECFNLTDTAHAEIARKTCVVKRIELYAEKNNLTYAMLTISLPSQYHSNPANAKDTHTWDSQFGVKEGHNRMNAYFHLVKANLLKHAIRMIGVKANERMGDGTPHLHYVIFFKEEQLATIVKYLTFNMPSLFGDVARVRVGEKFDKAKNKGVTVVERVALIEDVPKGNNHYQKYDPTICAKTVHICDEDGEIHEKEVPKEELKCKSWGGGIQLDLKAVIPIEIHPDNFELDEQGHPITGIASASSYATKYAMKSVNNGSSPETLALAARRSAYSIKAVTFFGLPDGLMTFFDMSMNTSSKLLKELKESTIALEDKIDAADYARRMTLIDLIWHCKKYGSRFSSVQPCFKDQYGNLIRKDKLEDFKTEDKFIDLSSVQAHIRFYELWVLANKWKFSVHSIVVQNDREDTVKKPMGLGLIKKATLEAFEADQKKTPLAKEIKSLRGKLSRLNKKIRLLKGLASDCDKSRLDSLQYDLADCLSQQAQVEAEFMEGNYSYAITKSNDFEISSGVHARSMQKYIRDEKSKAEGIELKKKKAIVEAIKDAFSNQKPKLEENCMSETNCFGMLNSLTEDPSVSCNIPRRVSNILNYTRVGQKQPRNPTPSFVDLSGSIKQYWENLADALYLQSKAIKLPFDKHAAIKAAAGSGKTYVLTNRVKYMTESGVDPASIVLITFTRKAATNLKKKLNELKVKGVMIGTFHAVSAMLLAKVGLTANGLNTVVAEAAKIGTKEYYLLIDEAQDMSHDQLDFAEAHGKSVFAVGDIRQALYGFRGGIADGYGQFPLSNEGHAIDLLGNKAGHMVHNMRCAAVPLAFANALQAKEAPSVAIKAGGSLKLAAAGTRKQEIAKVIEAVNALMSNDELKHEDFIKVLTATNDERRAITQRLFKLKLTNDYITVETIHASKRLDRDHIIVFGGSRKVGDDLQVKAMDDEFARLNKLINAKYASTNERHSKSVLKLKPPVPRKELKAELKDLNKSKSVLQALQNRWYVRATRAKKSVYITSTGLLPEFVRESLAIRTGKLEEYYEKYKVENSAI